MAGKRELDLSFELAGERFYFSRIPVWTFSAPWDVDFGGKKYARLKHLPSSADKNLSCTVTVHQGEPELEVITSPCRVPVNAPIRKADSATSGPGNFSKLTGDARL
jgi:hypothetical protein